MAMGAMLRWPRSGVAPSRLPAADRHCRVGVTKPQKVSCSHSEEVFAHFRKGDLTKHSRRRPRRSTATGGGRSSGPTASGGGDDLLSPSFLEGHEGLVPVGDVGTGKTHMAEAKGWPPHCAATDGWALFPEAAWEGALPPL